MVYAPHLTTKLATLDIVRWLISSSQSEIPQLNLVDRPGIFLIVWCLRSSGTWSRMICGEQKEAQWVSEFACLRAHATGALTRLRVKSFLRVLTVFVLGALIVFGISPLASSSVATCRMSCCARMATCCCRPSRGDSATPSKGAYHRRQAIRSCPRTCAGAMTAASRFQQAVGGASILPYDPLPSGSLVACEAEAFESLSLPLLHTRSPPVTSLPF